MSNIIKFPAAGLDFTKLSHEQLCDAVSELFAIIRTMLEGMDAVNATLKLQSDVNEKISIAISKIGGLK